MHGSVLRVFRHRYLHEVPPAFLLTGCTFLAFIILFLTYGFHNWTALRFSKFYDIPAQNQRLSQRDNANEAAAVRYIESLIQNSVPSAEQFPLEKIPSDVNLCAVMVTVPRKRRYFYQALSSILLSNCDDSIRARTINQRVCPLSTNIPSLDLHILYNHLQPHPDFEVLVQANISHVKILDQKRLPPAETGTSWWSQETADYTTALRFCRDDYEKRKLTGDDRVHLTLIVQDDSVTTRRSIDKLIAGLKPLLKANDWLVVQLFLSTHMNGWETDDWPVIVGLSFLGGICGFSIAISFDYCLRSRGIFSAKIKSSVFYFSGFFVTVIAGCGTACVLLMMNKQNLPFFAPEVGLNVDTDGTGAIGMVYSTAHVSGLLEYMWSPERRPNLPLDLAVNDFVKETGLMKYHLVPDLFDHRGVFTSEPNTRIGGYVNLRVSSTFEDEVDMQRFSQ